MKIISLEISWKSLSNLPENIQRKIYLLSSIKNLLEEWLQSSVCAQCSVWRHEETFLVHSTSQLRNIIINIIIIMGNIHTCGPNECIVISGDLFCKVFHCSHDHYYVQLYQYCSYLCWYHETVYSCQWQPLLNQSAPPTTQQLTQ